jgi:Family of unknown function (DUF5957)
MTGIGLTEIVGIIVFLLFDRAVGIRFLPIYLAIVCAAPIVDMRLQRRST